MVVGGAIACEGLSGLRCCGRLAIPVCVWCGMGRSYSAQAQASVGSGAFSFVRILSPSVDGA